MKEKYENFIGIYDNLLTKEECSNFINYYSYLKKNGFTLDHSYENHRADQEECNITHYDLNASNPIGPLFFEKTGEAVNQYLKKYSVLGQSDFLFYDLKLKHIPPAGGFHQWHYENTDPDYGKLFAYRLLYVRSTIFTKFSSCNIKSILTYFVFL